MRVIELNLDRLIEACIRRGTASPEASCDWPHSSTFVREVVGGHERQIEPPVVRQRFELNLEGGRGGVNALIAAKRAHDPRVGVSAA